METINDFMNSIRDAYGKLDPDLKVFFYNPSPHEQLYQRPEITILLSNGRRMSLHQSGPYYRWDMVYVRKFFRVTRKLLHRQLLNRIGLKITDIWAD